MTKPFKEEDLNVERQQYNDAMRLAKMFSSFIKMSEATVPVTSMKQAANEVAAKLEELRGELEIVKAELDTKRAEMKKCNEDIVKVVADKVAESLALDQTIAAKQSEVERLSAARKQFLESVGVKS